MSSSLEVILKASGRTSLEALKSVKGLHLAFKRLTSVPECIGQLTNLTELGLGNNKLSSLPESVGKLTNLKGLDLSHNKVEFSSLPESIGLLTNLTGLGLNCNKLSLLFESIGQLTNLNRLDLSNNKFSSLPESIGQHRNLTYLSLYNNPITELPEFIARLKNLKVLVVINDKGEIQVRRAPIGITALPCWNDTNKWENQITNGEALKKLKLYSNHINENLTDINSLIEKWKACDCISISNNKISTLPDQLSTLTELCDFNISNNMFATFPDVLLKMSWLTSLNIAGNSFTELPEGIIKLVNLTNLEIKDSNAIVTLQHAPVNISTLPCYNANADLKKLTVAPSPVIIQTAVQIPIVEFPAEM